MPSLKYILEKSKSRPPHCFSAHVPGHGYVNRGELAESFPEFWHQYQRAAESEITNMGFAPHYAEPGYEQPKRGVLLANWNHLARGLDTILERTGYAVEWSDEWITCTDCNGAVRTEPDSYDWQPAFRITDDGDIYCRACDPLTAVGKTLMAFSDEREPTTEFLFDVAQALYWYCHDFHGGQWSDEYAVLSRLDYKPGASERGVDPESTAALIYEALENGECPALEAFQWFSIAWKHAKARED